jgi:hypothetical protein
MILRMARSIKRCTKSRTNGKGDNEEFPMALAER